MADNTLLSVLERCKCHLIGTLYFECGILYYEYSKGQPEEVWKIYLKDRQIIKSLCPKVKIIPPRIWPNGSITATLTL